MDLTLDSVNAGLLKGIRLLSVREGVARIRLLTGEVQVQAGDVIGADLVTRVETRRIILTRPAGPDELGDGKVIVTFDAQGRGRVHVYLMKADTPPPVALGEGN
jgi:hypothetical protein